ncbi:MAG: CGNR zinc finger domain-containing protein [Acidobacteria bacterium]|nr:CGNR zinc finger domain-containing protein [Acidobacteriota bacterium]
MEEWKDGFLFVGHQLALDFLNTRPMLHGEAQELLPDFSSLLRWFQAAGVIGSRESITLQKQWGDSARARRTLEEIRELREELRKEVLAWEAGGKLHRGMMEKLNGLLAAHPIGTRLSETSSGPRLEPSFEPGQPEDLLTPLVHSAAKLFAECDRTRIRKCGQCVLHFLDTSKKGTRRWCSMQLCGNRLKVAAYSRRRKQSSGQ